MPDDLPAFFHGVFDMIKDNGLDTLGGNGAGFSSDKLEPLRVQLAALPGVDYGTYGKYTMAGSDGILQRGPIGAALRRKMSGL